MYALNKASKGFLHAWQTTPNMESNTGTSEVKLKATKKLNHCMILLSKGEFYVFHWKTTSTHAWWEQNWKYVHCSLTADYLHDTLTCITLKTRSDLKRCREQGEIGLLTITV